jgi:hypothetical protein
LQFDQQKPAEDKSLLASEGPFAAPAPAPPAPTSAGPASPGPAAAPVPAAPAPLQQPTVVSGPLGEVNVVPDGFEGPMPPGALRESDYRKRAALLDKIESGGSSLGVDISGFGSGLDPQKDPAGYAKAMEEGLQFKDTTNGYLRDLIKTDPGFLMMNDLDASKLPVSITAAQGADVEGSMTHFTDLENGYLDTEGKASKGSGSTISMARGKGEVPWQGEPSQMALYHELVHAWHGVHGDSERGDYYGTANAEFQAVGLGHYSESPVSENKIRKAMNAPRRPDYSGNVPEEMLMGTWKDPDR